MTDTTQHRIDYLEFAVDSIAVAKAFYGQAFDWTFQDYGPDYCEFRDGRLSGGFFHGTPQPGGALVVLASDDLARSQARIEAAGGHITQPVFAFPGGRLFTLPTRTAIPWQCGRRTKRSCQNGCGRGRCAKSGHVPLVRCACECAGCAHLTTTRYALLLQERK